MASCEENFATDIVARVRQDFGDQADLVLEQLRCFCQSHTELANPRMIRCIIHAAQGKRSGIVQCIDLAIGDYRDLIVAAEYQTRPGTKSRQGIYERIHDFNQPFSI